MAGTLNAGGTKTLDGGTISGALGGAGTTTVQTGTTTLTGTIGGGMYAAQEDFNILLGIVAGFVASFLLVVATCGLPFLVVEINNNLIRIRDELKRTP